MEIKLINVRLLIRERILSAIMKTFFFLMCTTVFCMNTKNTLSQEIITIKKDQLVTIDKVFKIIKKQTDYNFDYPKKLFKNAPRVQLNKGVIKLAELLENSLLKNDFSFELNSNNNILIRKSIDNKEGNSQGFIDSSLGDISGSSAKQNLRVLSYNVFNGSTFPLDNGDPPVTHPNPIRRGQTQKDRTASFARILKAIDPDIMSIQEAWVHRDSIRKTEAGMRSYVSKLTSKKWYTAKNKVQREIVFSKYPIKWSRKLDLTLAVLIDLPDDISKEDLLMFNVHLPSGGLNGRINNAKLVVDLVERVRNGEVPEVPSNSMVLVVGDYNTSYNGHPYKIISSLDTSIKASDSYEPKLKDLRPIQLEGDPNNHVTFGATTFKDNTSSVSGISIDHMLFSGGALEMTNSFILNTLILDESTLNEFELKRSDIAANPNQPLEGEVHCNHLPVVSDFKTKN